MISVTDRQTDIREDDASRDVEKEMTIDSCTHLSSIDADPIEEYIRFAKAKVFY